MNEEDREWIQTNYTGLADAIAPDIKILTKELFRRKLISSAMSDSVIEKHITDMDRAMALLDLIPKRGRQAMETFYTSCLTRELWDAADILRPAKCPHGPSVLPPAQPSGRGEGEGQFLPKDASSDEEPYPDVWPPDQVPDLMRPKVYTATDLEEKKAKKYKQRYKDAHTTQGQERNYSMIHTKRALVYVINNNIFTTLANRDGTDKDAYGIRMLFHNLGCQVKVLQDQTAKDMWKELLEMCRIDFSSFDCFILFVLTHGHKGVVFGTDGKENIDEKKIENFIEIQDITDLFGNVKSLTGKPKLFFFQACQGTDRDSGTPVVLPTKADGLAPLEKSAKNMSMGPEAGDKSSDHSLDYITDERSDSLGEKLPSRVDVFVAMATTPDTVSWRRPDYGTWFIQAIIEVFARYAYRFDLQKLMTRVNGLIVRAVTTKGGYKQVMEKRDTFMKQFYFFPGLSDPENM